MKYLFIGGPADGERVDILTSSPTWVMNQRQPYNAVELTNRDTVAVEAFVRTEYKREILVDINNNMYYVYIAEGVNAIAKLLEGYRKPHAS